MKKYNFTVNLTQKEVSIEVSTSIFPLSITLHAAYHFIEDKKVIIDRKKDKIVVMFVLEKDEIKESDLEDLAYEFNIQLISSFVEGIESEKHAQLREEMMKAALSLSNIPPGRPQGFQSKSRQENPPKPQNTQEKQLE